MSNTDYTVDVEVTEDITPTVDTGDATSSSLDDEQIFLSAEINPDELIDAEVNTNELIDITVQESVGSTETDHRLLTHRDAPEQHPMSAITGLNTTLQNMSASIDSRLTADENGIILLQVETEDHTQRLGVVEDDVVDAAKVATNYVTALDSNGIKLHAVDSPTLNYIRLNGDGMDVYKSGISASSFGDIARIGREDGTHLELDAAGMRAISGSGGRYFSIEEGEMGDYYQYDVMNEPKNYKYWLYGGTKSCAFDLGDEAVPQPSSATWTYYHAPEEVRDIYNALSVGDEFQVKVDYYCTRSSSGTSATILYDTIIKTFTKGTYVTTDSYVWYSTPPAPPSARYFSGDSISVRATPPLPSNNGSYYNPTFIVSLGTVTTGLCPFYRFGIDCATSGGALSVVMGRGTVADYENQVAMGTFNVSQTDRLLMVGNGTSNSSRSNALSLHKSGDLAIAGALTQSSDRRLKEHINYLGEEAVEFVRQLKPTHYIKGNKHHVGFYAQDVEAADKWHCMTDEMNGFKTLCYTELIAPLVAYCQSLEQRIEELERN